MLRPVRIFVAGLLVVAVCSVSTTVAQDRPFGFLVHGHTSLGLPMGDFYNGIDPTVGFGLEFTYPVASDLSLRAMFSRAGLQENFRENRYFPWQRVVDDDLVLSTWRYMAAVQYFKWPRWQEGQPSFYYVYGGMGIVHHAFDGSHTFFDESLNVTGERGFDSRTNFALTTGVGFVYQFARKFGLEFGTVLDIIFVGDSDEAFEAYGGEAYAYIFDFRVGLVFLGG